MTLHPTSDLDDTPQRHPDAPLRDFTRSLPMALMRARESVMARFRPILAEHDLTEQQWRVLRALGDSASAMSVGELADRTLLLGPSLSRMLASMERRGLIHRTPASDARRAEIVITDRGRGLLGTIGPSSEAAYALIERQLDEGELDELHRLLHKIGAT